MFASCQADADVATMPDSDGAISFSAESISPLTRVSNNEWEAGDVISIYMQQYSGNISYENVRYVATESGSTVSFAPESEIIYHVDSSEKSTAVAYYPYQEVWSYAERDMIFDLSGQDGTLEAQVQSDLLRAIQDEITSGVEVVFQFVHYLSKIQVTVSNFDTYSAFEDLSNLSATYNTTGTHYNAFNETIIASDEPKAFGMVKEVVDDNTVVFSVIVAPGSVNHEIVLTDGTTSYTATREGGTTAKGKQYNYTAVVGDQGLSLVELDSDGVTDWDSQSESTLDTDLEIVDGIYQISSAIGLKMFADLVNGGETSLNAKLMRDINLNGSADDQWTPIGGDLNRYGGTFDGCGYEVSGLYIDNGDLYYQGLFGFVNGATISNLGVAGSVTGNQPVGGVVGSANSTTVVNCYNKAAVTGSFNAGGIVGVASYSGTIIANCYNLGSISGTSGSGRIGGIVGGIDSGLITSCYSAAAVSGDFYVGGLAGSVNALSATVTSCYYDSTLYTGSAIGDGSGDVTGFATADMRSESMQSYLNSAAYDYNQTSPSITAYAWKVTSGNYPELDFENSNPVPNLEYNSNDNVYYIHNTAGFEEFAALVDGTNYINATLMCDVVLSGTWSPICANGSSTVGYKGTFDGNGYSITGLSVSGSESGQGLFGTTNDATIKNLTVGGNVSNSASHTAIIVGKAWRTSFENCETLEGSTVTGTSGDSCAGISGYAYNCSFTSCINRAEVTGVSCTAGIVGYSNDNVTGGTNITSCKNYGDITSGNYAAGIAATTSDSGATLIITNCYNEGDIATSTGDFAGGIVAKLYGISSEQGKLLNCANYGTITCYRNYVGGLVGACAGATIYNSYNRGDVSGSNKCVGGLVGIHETYTYGDVITAAYIDNCYSVADVSGETNVGLIFGQIISSTVAYCYYDKSLSGSAVGTVDDDTNVSYDTYLTTKYLYSDLTNRSRDISGADEWYKSTSLDSGYPTFTFLVE